MSHAVEEVAVTAHLSHRSIAITAGSLDAAVARYLPASPEQLRAEIDRRTGTDYADVCDVTALLMVLAELDDRDRGIEAPTLAMHVSPHDLAKQWNGAAALEAHMLDAHGADARFLRGDVSLLLMEHHNLHEEGVLVVAHCHRQPTVAMA